MLNKKSVKLEISTNYGGEISETIKERLHVVVAEEIEKCSKEFYRDIDVKLSLEIK